MDKMQKQGKLIILSGPSCVGKGPITAALEAYLKSENRLLRKQVLYNTRAPRPDEEDGKTYRFVPSAKKLEDIKDQGNTCQYKIFKVGNDSQMIDLDNLKTDLDNEKDIVLLEIYHKQIDFIADFCTNGKSHKVKQIFISPLSDADFKFIKGCIYSIELGVLSEIAKTAAITAIMYNKLICRDTDLPEDQQKRAKRAAEELQNCIDNGYIEGGTYKVLLPNHYGEDQRLLWDELTGFVSKADALRSLLDYLPYIINDKLKNKDENEVFINALETLKMSLEALYPNQSNGSYNKQRKIIEDFLAIQGAPGITKTFVEFLKIVDS